MQRRYWPGGDAVGARVRFGESGPIEIVGVVGDVLHEALDAEPRPEIFFPHRQSGAGGMTYFVRTSRDPASIVSAVQREIWAVEPLQAFYRIATMDELMANTLRPRRFTMMLMIGFSMVSVLMAGVGVYGVISYYVSSRTHELGVRMALGASEGGLVRSIVRRGLTLTGIGMVVGYAGALILTRGLSRFLFGVSPADLLSFAGAGVALLTVAALACYVPARRATRVDPVIALRYE